MRRILLVFLLGITACNNPQNNHQQNQLTDKQREQLLKEKKKKIAVGHTDSTEKTALPKLEIQFTPYVPAYPDLGEEGLKIIQSRLSNIIAKFGVSGNPSDPSFALVPAINLVEKNITATAPTMFENAYEITFYTTNLLDGTIFSSASFNLKGVGASSAKAFINALQSSTLDEKSFGKLLTEGQAKALIYYQNNCDKIISRAQTEASQQNYSSAFLILKSIPPSASCYSKASPILQDVFKKKIASDCSKLLNQMRADFGKKTDTGGYNETAMSDFALIPADAPCFKEALKEYNTYKKTLDPNARARLSQQEKELDLRKEKQELEAQVAIDGQTALLNKYEKDHEYDKLPWLRKLVHLGEWDPFDATSRINKK